MTMHHIASASLSSNGQIVFGNIPSTYTHLHVRASIRANYGVSGSALYTSIYKSGSTGYVFSDHELRGDGATAISNGATGLPYIYAGSIMPGTTSLSNNFGILIMDILDYSNPSKFKTMKIYGGYDNNGSGNIMLQSGLIQTLDICDTFFVDSDGNLLAGSRVDLYGITSNPIATGA